MFNQKKTPVERFLCFLPNVEHKSEDLEKAVKETLDLEDIELRNCRGQSYDNASNMSEAYTGLQSGIKNLSPHAIYVPCSAHSLNWVGQCAAEYTPEACLFLVWYKIYIHFFAA